MPWSIWASVPKNTRPRDSANSTTVNRSDAIGARVFFSADQAVSGRRSRGVGPEGGRADRMPVEGSAVLLMVGSCAVVEPDGINKCLEGGFLLADQFGRAGHLEEPRLA